MNHNFLKILKEISLNRVSLFFLLAHWVLMAVALFMRDGLDKILHMYYEPLLLQILILLDAPSIIITALIESVFELKQTNEIFITKSIIFQLLVSLQWMLVGYAIKWLFQRRKRIS